LRRLDHHHGVAADGDIAAYRSPWLQRVGLISSIIARAGAGGLMAKVPMDILIEALFQAVLSEENKPLSVRHRQVKNRIREVEGAIRQWTKPKLSDPNNERVLLEFRERLRQRLQRGTTQAIGGTASYLIDVLRILVEIEGENFSPPRKAEL
jgi:hypothetical protein